jgi:hypothetical protein
MVQLSEDFNLENNGFPNARPKGALRQLAAARASHP